MVKIFMPKIPERKPFMKRLFFLCCLMVNVPTSNAINIPGCFSEFFQGAKRFFSPSPEQTNRFFQQCWEPLLKSVSPMEHAGEFAYSKFSSVPYVGAFLKEWLNRCGKARCLFNSCDIVQIGSGSGPDSVIQAGYDDTQRFFDENPNGQIIKKILPRLGKTFKGLFPVLSIL
jgi:hypothetical protein